MKKVTVLLCALYLVLAYGTAFAAAPTKPPTVSTTLNDIPPAWSKILQCDTTACPRFELVMGGAAVLDHETGLVWERSPDASPQGDWYDAKYYCQSKLVGARKGWRLPTVEEFSSLLVDPATTSPPPLPSGHPFTNVQTLGFAYWSSTTHAYYPDAAWVVDMAWGGLGYTGKSAVSPFVCVWCVRGGHGYDAY